MFERRVGFNLKVSMTHSRPLLDATRRYSTLLDATRRYSTLLDATRRYSTLLDNTRRYSTLLLATLGYSTLSYATLRHAYVWFHQINSISGELFGLDYRPQFAQYQIVIDFDLNQFSSNFECQ
jgi:hypothetical protein